MMNIVLKTDLSNPNMATHFCIPGTQEAEPGGSSVQDEAGLRTDFKASLG